MQIIRLVRESGERVDISVDDGIVDCGVVVIRRSAGSDYYTYQSHPAFRKVPVFTQARAYVMALGEQTPTAAEEGPLSLTVFTGLAPGDGAAELQIEYDRGAGDTRVHPMGEHQNGEGWRLPGRVGPAEVVEDYHRRMGCVLLRQGQAELVLQLLQGRVGFQSTRQARRASELEGRIVAALRTTPDPEPTEE